MVYAVVTGGGTSGHVIPAQAVLEGLIESGHSPSELRYVGSRRGIERTLMSGTGIACEYLPISGLQRSFSAKGILRNIAIPMRLMRSRVIARSLIKKWSPRVVVSVGGYASEPMAAAAIASGIPLVCVSYDRSPGLATRRQSRHAAISAVAFEGSTLHNALLTGAPVRAELRHLDVAARRQSARRELGIPDDVVLVSIVGGSLGSGILNDLAGPLMMAMQERSPRQYMLFHVAGTRNEASFMPFTPDALYRRVGYESRMADLYAATDVLLCRAGASTVAEIATVGIASVIVPWSGAADNHQTKNALWLGDALAAVVCTESQCHDGTVVSEVMRLVETPSERETLARRARELGTLHRSGALISAIENAAL